MSATRTILVTGATGFMGRWLCRALSAHHDVVALVRDAGRAGRLKRSGPAGRIRLLEGDITAPETLRTAGADLCVHLAAVADVRECARDPLNALIVNAMGTQHILDACSKVGVKGFLLASSTKVYGETGGMLTEESSLQPRTWYGMTKVFSELLTRRFSESSHIPSSVVRIANVYGPQDPNATRVIPGTISSILAGKRPVMFGDGSAERVFIYVKDAVEFLILCLQQLDRGEGGVYNLGTPERHPIRAVIQEVADLMGWQGGIERMVAPDPLTSDGSLDIRRAVALGWKPHYSLREGLRETVDSYKEGGP